MHYQRMHTVQEKKTEQGVTPALSFKAASVNLLYQLHMILFFTMLACPEIPYDAPWTNSPTCIFGPHPPVVQRIDTEGR